MELQIYGSDWDLRIPNYSIVKDLLFDLVAQTPNRELAPAEKLFVVNSVDQPAHAGYLADIYLACGCFAEARLHYSKPEHPRKLGDICWCEGDLDQAETFYSKATGEAQSYRTSPDHDRLIKLAFFQGRWDRVIERFSEASFSRGFNPGAVIVGSGEVAARPYIDMLAVALTRSSSAVRSSVTRILESAFQISNGRWALIAADPMYQGEKMLQKLKRRCRPRIGAAGSVTLDDALRFGNTSRSRHVLAYIRDADEALASAQKHLAEYATTGNEGHLESFLLLVTGSGITSISQSFLFSAFGHGSFPRETIPPEHLMRLLSSHPVMNKRHFGELLDLRFRHRVPLTADDILAGLFQVFGRSSFRPTKRDDDFGLARLASCREWARLRLDDWLRHRSASLTEVASIWSEGRAKPAPHPFYPDVIEKPLSARNMGEWDALMSDALKWLRSRWKREIGNSRWIAENQLFQVIRQTLKGVEVQRHARPTWLQPQHLDVYVPKAGVAVEYMGQQHFEPLKVFGGAIAYEQVCARDARKAEQCRKNGIELIRVRFDEDVGLRARYIASHIRSCLAE